MPNFETCETQILVKPTFSRKCSKRLNDKSGEQTEFDESPDCKRPRHPTTVQCPLAFAGCSSEVANGNLEEHYRTQIHQEFVVKVLNSLKNQSVEDHSEIDEIVNLLQEGVSCLHDDTFQIQNNIVKVQNEISEHERQIEQIQNSIEETNQLVHATQVNMSVLETEIADLRQQIVELQSQFSNDGSLLWKVTDVSKKLKDAISEKQTSIYSPPFYSSPNGYKMCLRLYLYGDGHARRTHCSLFFVIMRGDYDNILQWPFHHKVIFCLFDQSGNQRHIIDSFRPDLKSISFQKPKSNMNIASGIPKFCPLAILQQNDSPYIRDDCMFIRCIVDFASTPKSMMSFLCNINLGLPTLNQQMLIRDEIDRQNKLTAEEPKK